MTFVDAGNDAVLHPHLHQQAREHAVLSWLGEAGVLNLSKVL